MDDRLLIHPNLHVVLLHYPLALLVAGTLIELFSFFWRRHSFRVAGRWMILLGALTAIPTVTSGIYALRHVAGMNTRFEHDSGAWKDVVAVSRLNSEQWEMLDHHVWHQSIATGLAVIAVITWLGCSDRWRARLHLPLLAVLLIGVGFAASGARYGGEAVYAHGVAVDPQRGRGATTAPATQPAETATSASAPATARVADSPVVKEISRITPPIQMHVIFAGVVVALGMASLGLSIRKISQPHPATQVDHIAQALGGPPTLMDMEGRDNLVIESPLPEPPDIHPRVPASKFWILTFVVAVLTALGGYALVMLSQERFWSFSDFWDIIREHKRQANYRLLAHLCAGSTIVVLPLFLALISRWAPRGKWMLVLFSILLIGAIVAQIVFGIELLYDSRQGPLMRFGT